MYIQATQVETFISLLLSNNLYLQWCSAGIPKVMNAGARLKRGSH